MTATKDASKPPIDPRIRERRNTVARSVGRRRLYLLLAVLVAIGGYFAARALLRTSLFSIQKFDIVGGSHYTYSALISQSGIETGFPLTEVNPKVVAHRLEQLPWDGAVTVRKKWPNTLQVSIKDRTALAVVPQSSKSQLLVDSTGRVLASQASSKGRWLQVCMMASIPSSKALAQVNGCESQNLAVGSFLPPSFLPLLEVAAALHADPVARFSKVAISSSGEIDGLLSSGVAVRFGSVSQLNAKLRALQLLLSQASTTGYSTIDLRVPTEPVLSNW